MIALEGIKARLPDVASGDRDAALRVDGTVFSTSAALRTAYKFTDCCHLFLEHAKGDEQGLVVTFRSKSPEVDLGHVIGEFSNELIDQQIREELAHEAGVVREIIVAHAFAEGNLLRVDEEDEESSDDPFGVGRLRGRGPLSTDRS